ncbi:uncharacterized protein L969DRAFT_52040 [Mixia osmundae IAM 14324]|uniref:Uncharacterized protein n=1 Tax=Mixia osmundae (strain CBS 9802 / IAM 14324 / JCM 22182 / KY 12970) TaxID=764103 RepID=G7E0N2_MIXOS|nr:uncharacterized protein L969DRAFT_52040 [Mixia osmundae IAM 14324]KEI37868.1 hypothetical protein L969DRAFT_52040 [Mixia osmundae IAM 14324]GAA96392.1 hypothetical protein E5Q_03059 [Mixia osmundae IAM 14324]
MLDFLDYSWLMDVAKATGGIAVILEPRYWGKSIPVSNFTTDSMRFSSTLQSIADAKHFASNVVFAGFEGLDLTYKNAMWITVAMEYGGVKAAIARSKYPDVFSGAVAVTPTMQSIANYWQYYDAVIEYGIKDCTRAMQVSMLILDLLVDAADPAHLEAIKDGFGMTGVTHIKDVLIGLAVSSGPDNFVNSFWKQNGGVDLDYAQFCSNLTAPFSARPGHSQADRAKAVELVKASGFMTDKHHEDETIDLAATWLLNWMAWFKPTGESWKGKMKTADEMWSTYDPTGWAVTDLSNTWRPYFYSKCTEWPFFRSGFGRPESAGLPVVSRHLDYEFMHQGCQLAFPPGKVHSIPTEPDVAAMNQLGGWSIAFDQLAIVCSKKDPWRQATPCADQAPVRNSTVQQPFVYLEDIGHNGMLSAVRPDETNVIMPESIKTAQAELLTAVKTWHSNWKKPITKKRSARAGHV